VDASRFAANPESLRRAAGLRQQLGIPEQATVILFVGRLTRDKGIPESMQAFLQLDELFPDLRLLLVGCFEDEDPLPVGIRRTLETHEHVIFAGAVQDTPAFYAIADIVVLPSHREGLPTVILEAQAAGKPVVGARATGIVDLIADGETGLLFPVGDVPALIKALARLVSDKALASKLGLASQEQVKREFQQGPIWEALHREYLAVLQQNGPPTSFLPRDHKSRGLVVGSNE
jgi:glycosyltransferase involved in cell wall biosynthesis